MTDPRSAMPDDLGRAYRDASALADGARAPAATVRANVLAAAREVAASAARETPTSIASAGPAGDAPRPAPEPLELTIPGVGRALAANLSSWRVRAGAVACVALMAATVAWRYDDRLARPDPGVEVASVDLLPSRDPRLARPAAPALTVLPPPAASQPPPEPLPMTVAADAAPSAVQAAPAMVASADRRAERSSAAPVEAERAASEATAPWLVALAPAARQRVATAAAAAPAGRMEADTSAPVAGSGAAAPVTVPGAAVAPVALSGAAAPERPTSPSSEAAPPAVVALAFPSPAPAPAPQAISPAPAAAPAPQRVELTASSLRRAEAASDAAAPASGEAHVAVAKSSIAGGSSRGVSTMSATAGSPPPPALQQAADAGDAAAIARLLAAGAAVDAPDAQGRTALLHAVLAQRLEAVHALLDAGADPGRADAAGLTPRAAARRGADAAIAALFGPR